MLVEEITKQSGQVDATPDTGSNDQQLDQNKKQSTGADYRAKSNRQQFKQQQSGLISREHLLEAGVHFGHQTRHWNPKMKPYIFTQRNGVYIIDLNKTMQKLTEAFNFLKETAANKGKFLFVGTKKQVRELVAQQAKRCESYFVNYRWLGGTLTNFKTIHNCVQKLISIEQKEKSGELDILPKKERSDILKLKDKLELTVGGIREMRELPDAIIVLDPKIDDIVVKEANILHIPVVALVDTNVDPEPINYFIPSNDDAVKSLTLMSILFANAIIEGRTGEPVKLELPFPKRDPQMYQNQNNNQGYNNQGYRQSSYSSRKNFDAPVEQPKQEKPE